MLKSTHLHRLNDTLRGESCDCTHGGTWPLNLNGQDRNSLEKHSSAVIWPVQSLRFNTSWTKTIQQIGASAAPQLRLTVLITTMSFNYTQLSALTGGNFRFLNLHTGSRPHIHVTCIKFQSDVEKQLRIHSNVSHSSRQRAFDSPAYQHFSPSGSMKNLHCSD